MTRTEKIEFDNLSGKFLAALLFAPLSVPLGAWWLIEKVMPPRLQAPLGVWTLLGVISLVVVWFYPPWNAVAVALLWSVNEPIDFALLWFIKLPLVFGLTLPSFFLFWAKGINEAEGISDHGSARFANHSDLPSGEVGIVLGRLGHRIVRAPGHAITIASSGSGKGRSGVIPNLLVYPGSVWVLDVKGENFATTARARRGLGKVICIDPFGLTGNPSDSVNFLDAIDPKSEDCIEASQALADALVVPTEGRESHWDEKATELVQALLLHVSRLESHQRHLGTLRELVTLNATARAGLLEDLATDTELAFGIAARRAAAFSATPEREAGSIWSTVQRHTRFLDDPKIVRTLRDSSASLALKEETTSVFLAIPPHKLDGYRGFVRAHLDQALTAQMSAGQPPHPVLFILDEFPQLGRFSKVEQFFNTARGYGVRFWLLAQDLSQLKAHYPVQWSALLNSATLQVFGINEIEAAEYLSRRSGQQTVRTINHSTGAQENSSTSSHGRALMTADEILRLPEGLCLSFLPSAPVARLNRLDYLHDSEFRGRFDANPMHDAVGAK